jgi:hypothetical protein
MSRGPFNIEPGFSNRQAFSVGGSGQIDEQETILISSFTSGNPLDIGVTIQGNPTGLINGITDRVNLFVDELRAKKDFAIHSVEGGLALFGGTGFAVAVAGNPILDSDGTGLNVISPLQASSVNISGALITQDSNTFNGLTTFPLVCPQTATVPSNPEDLINLSYFQNNNPSAAVIFYLNNSLTPAPPISTYALLSNTQDGQPQSSIATSLSGIGTTQLVQSFANTLVNLNAGSFIPSGIWELNIFASADNAGSTTHMNLYFQLFGRTSLGVETQIGTNSALASVDATTTEQLKLSLALPYTDISSYESLVVKVYAICNRNNLTSITTYYEGTTTYSHMDTSFAVYVPPNILSLNNVWTGVNQFTQPIVGDITGNSATSTTTSSAPDSALSANVPLKDGTNIFTAVNTFQANTLFNDPLLPDVSIVITPSTNIVLDETGLNVSTATLSPSGLAFENPNVNMNITPGGILINRLVPAHQLQITASSIQSDNWTIQTNGSVQAGNSLTLNDIQSGNNQCGMQNYLGDILFTIPDNKIITFNLSSTPKFTISNTNITATVPINAQSISATTFTGDLLGNATTADTAGVATLATGVKLVSDNSAGTYFLPFSKTVSGANSLYVDNTTTPLTYNPSTSNLTATTFTGDLSGNASSASTIALTSDNTSGSYFLPFSKTTTTNNALYIDDTTGPLTYNPSTSTLTAATFSGTASSSLTTTAISLTSDNTSGTYYLPFSKTTSVGANTLYIDNTTTALTYNPNTSNLTATTFTGNASTATQLSTNTISTNATYYPTFVATTVGNQQHSTNSTLNFNPSTGNLTATTFTGLCSTSGLVFLQTLTGTLTGAATATTYTLPSIFNTTYKNYKIQFTFGENNFTAYPTISLNGFSGANVPTLADIYGYDITSGVMTTVSLANQTLSTTPIQMTGAALTNQQFEFDVFNVGYTTLFTANMVRITCNSIYNNPGVKGVRNITVQLSQNSSSSITGLSLQSIMGVGNNPTWTAKIYGYK